MDLMTQADIARLLGISRQAVSKLVMRREKNGFPEPVAKGVWRHDDVVAWQRSRQAS